MDEIKSSDVVLFFLKIGAFFLGLLLILFFITSAVTGISMFNEEIMKLLTVLFGITVFIVIILALALVGAIFGLSKSPVRNTGSMVVKDNALKYEYRDENSRKRKKSFSLTNIDRYLNDYKEMYLPDDLRLYKADPNKKSSAINLMVETSDKRKLSLKDLYFEDADQYNRICAFLDRISDKDEIDLEFRLRKYVAQENILYAGEDAVRTFKELRKEISDKTIKAQIDRTIENIRKTSTCIDQIDRDDQMRKLYDNYMDMLVEILKNYATLEKHEKRPEELNKAKEKLLQTFELINSAFDALISGKEEEKIEELEADAQSLEDIRKEETAVANKE
ncbi:MAG: hypothetical protein IJI92_03135 [Erysipelotrichaceae bacterium]|nr:hypothetical protein [Erysipelotrichaceae bacterium]